MGEFLGLTVYLILVAWATLYSLTIEIADIKQLNKKEARIKGLIPVWGLIQYITAPTQKTIHPDEWKNVLSIGNIIKRILRFAIFFGLVIGLYMIHWAFLLVIVIFFQSSMGADIAERKGYPPFTGALYGLLPVVGIWLILQFKNRKAIDKEAIWYTVRSEVWLTKLVLFAEIVALSVVVAVPIIYIVGMAVSNQQNNIPVTIWPEAPNFDAFIYLFEKLNFEQWYMNTLMIAIVDMVVGTVLITGAAYVFARGKFIGKKSSLLVLFVLQSFPSFLGLLAMFVLFSKFGLLGRPLALSILYIGGAIPGNIWLIKGYLNQVTKELDEAAIIDGANKLQIFFKIILPLSVPIISFVAVGMFMGPWMDYMLPGYLLNVPAQGKLISDIPSQYTLAVGLFQLINGGTYVAKHYAAFAAGALIVGGPITILYMVFQRYLIEGIMAGSTKG